MPFSKIYRNLNSAEPGERNKVERALGGEVKNLLPSIAFSYIHTVPFDDHGIAKTKKSNSNWISNKVLKSNFFLINQPRFSIACAQYCSAKRVFKIPQGL